MAIWAHNPSKDHSADLSFVAWVADHWAKLPNTMSKLAVVSIWACASFLPLITQLSLEHPLVIHYHFKRLFLFLPSTHIYLLLYTITTTNNINIYKTRSPQLFRIYSNIQVQIDKLDIIDLSSLNVALTIFNHITVVNCHGFLDYISNYAFIFRDRYTCPVHKQVIIYTFPTH